MKKLTREILKSLVLEVIQETDGYKKLAKQRGEIPHNWATHVEWKVSTKKRQEIGEVVDHTLLEDGTINYYTAKFGNKTYKNIPADKLQVVKEQEHSHARKAEPEEEDD